MTDTRKRVSLLDAIDDAMTEPTANGTVYLDGATWAEAQTVRKELTGATKATGDGLRSDVPRLTGVLDQLMSKLRESELVFTFRQLPKTESSALIDAHQTGAEEGMAWNGDTYPPALVQAACVAVTGVYEAPGISVEEVAGLWERLGQAQTDELFRAAFTLQLEAPKPFLYAATEPTRGPAPSGTGASG